MSDQSAGVPFDDKETIQRERKGPFEEGSLGRACLFTFAVSATATLIICGAVRGPRGPELWHRIQMHRVSSSAAKRDTNGASTPTGSANAEQTFTQG